MKKKDDPIRLAFGELNAESERARRGPVGRRRAGRGGIVPPPARRPPAASVPAARRTHRRTAARRDPRSGAEGPSSGRLGHRAPRPRRPRGDRRRGPHATPASPARAADRRLRSPRGGAFPVRSRAVGGFSKDREEAVPLAGMLSPTPTAPLSAKIAPDDGSPLRGAAPPRPPSPFRRGSRRAPDGHEEHGRGRGRAARRRRRFTPPCRPWRVPCARRRRSPRRLRPSSRPCPGSTGKTETVVIVSSKRDLATGRARRDGEGGDQCSCGRLAGSTPSRGATGRRTRSSSGSDLRSRSSATSGVRPARRPSSTRNRACSSRTSTRSRATPYRPGSASGGSALRVLGDDARSGLVVLGLRSDSAALDRPRLGRRRRRAGIGNEGLRPSRRPGSARDVRRSGARGSSWIGTGG